MPYGCKQIEIHWAQIQKLCRQKAARENQIALVSVLLVGTAQFCVGGHCCWFALLSYVSVDTAVGGHCSCSPGGHCTTPPFREEHKQQNSGSNSYSIVAPTSFTALGLYMFKDVLKEQ